MSDILEYVYGSTIIRKYIRSLMINNKSYSFDGDDLMSHILLELSKKDLNCLIDLYNTNKLDYFVNGMIRNQLKSNNSSFHKEYSIVYKSGESVKSDELNFDIIDLNGKYNDYPDILLDKVDNALLSIEPTKALLFKLYYFDDMTYSDIAREIGIDKQVVRLNVIKVLKKIREYIENEEEKW